jgi:photosystem II stability/assembly factor-like uncharacterized protein
MLQGHAQTQRPWLRPLENSGLSFYAIENAFSKAYKKKGKKILKQEREELRESRRRNGGNVVEQEADDEVGYFQFRRWENDYLPRVFPSGDLSLPSATWDRFLEYLNATPAAREMYQAAHAKNRIASIAKTQTGTWTFLGPVGAPAGGGAGRINFIKVDPSDTNVLYAGGPNSGLWKSTDGGVSWATTTDFLNVIGCSDLVFHPANSQILFLATGDGDGSDSYSTGVLKSSDGGQTWNTTGLTFAVSQKRVISKLLINPINPSIMMAASNVGIFRTIDGGTTWTQLKAGYFTDLEFKPGDPSTVYAAGYNFFRSTNDGATWSMVTDGLPSSNVTSRLAIAVTPADSSYVYLLATDRNNAGFYGLYRSEDSGTTFKVRSIGTPVNILGKRADGSDTLAPCQGWYDLAIDASPINAEEIMVGGINVWRSTTGGATWALNTYWVENGAPVPYVHADIHSVNYINDSTLYAGCDGGVYKTTDKGLTWTDISHNMSIAQVYRIGLSASDPDLWLTGHQDNGTNLRKGTTDSMKLSGDGMECFIDRTGNSVMYASLHNGWFHRSTDSGYSWTDISPMLKENAEWVAPWCQDPAEPNTLWAGYENVWRSVDKGTNWIKMGTLPTNGTIIDMQVAPSNNQVLYVCKRDVSTYPYTSTLYKTADGGTTWFNVTSNLPVGSAMITAIAVKPIDPNTVWVCFSGYSAGTKVYKTTDGGDSWTNVSAGLPNLPINCIRTDPASSFDALYLGSDVGVYYLDNSFASWQPYFTDLPNVSVRDIKIFAPTGKIRVATFGRGIWENTLYAKVLPLTLLSFEGSLTSQKAAELTWKTANETAVSHYEIEHSTNNVIFINIGFQQASGNTTNTYHFTHLQTVNGSNFYRLKMVNADGTFRYSQTIKLDVERSQFVTQVSPNPFMNFFKFVVESPLATKAVIRLTDAAGKTVALKQVALSQGVNEIIFGPDDVKGSGTYLLHIEAADYRGVMKVVKTK